MCFDCPKAFQQNQNSLSACQHAGPCSDRNTWTMCSVLAAQPMDSTGFILCPWRVTGAEDARVWGTGWREVHRADEVSSPTRGLASPDRQRWRHSVFQESGRPCCPVHHSGRDLPAWRWLCAASLSYVRNYSASRRWSAAGICSPGFLGPAPQDRAPASRPGPTPHLSPALQDHAGILHCTGCANPPVGLCAPPRPRPLVLHRHPAHVLPFVSLRLLSVLDHSTRCHCGTRKVDCPEFLVEPLTLPHGLEPTLGFLWPHCMFVS